MKRLLLLGQFPDTDFHWKGVLCDASWQVDELAFGGSLPPLVGYTVVILRVESLGTEALLQLLDGVEEGDCTGFLPVLFEPSVVQVVELIRRGVTDVLLHPVSRQGLLDAVARVERRRGLLTDNLGYNLKLEVANKELTESLNILKMDQIAGREAQKSLLPHKPIVHKGYTVTHTIIPSLYLSGDFVAYNLAFDKYILFFLADVSGHGASSAFVTILLRFILKRIISKHVRENDMVALSRAPEGFIEHVNRQMLATGLEKQVTMFGGAINTDTHMLRYAVAAQMPMPVFIVGNDARFLPGKGKVIGLFEDAYWEIREIALPAEFRLVMVSDGLLETLPGTTLEDREEYLVDRLANAAGDHASMCRALGVDQLTEVTDDVSILSICRGGTS